MINTVTCELRNWSNSNLCLSICESVANWWNWALIEFGNWSNWINCWCCGVAKHRWWSNPRPFPMEKSWEFTRGKARLSGNKCAWIAIDVVTEELYTMQYASFPELCRFFVDDEIMREWERGGIYRRRFKWNVSTIYALNSVLNNWKIL